MSNDKTLATVKHGGCVQLGTPGSRWAASGEPDPQGTRYDCERAALVMGDLTDDELANAVFMHGNERQTMADLVGGATPAIAYLTAAKDRIRWLSRALAAAESLSAQPSPGGQGDALDLVQRYDEAAEAFALAVSDDHYSDARRAELRRGVTAARNAVVSALAARQPVGEPERRAPVQGYHGKTVPWRVHGMAWEVYARKYRGQDAEKIASRGGFAVEEMDAFLPGWRDMAEGAPAQAVDLDELCRAVCVVNVVGQIDGHDVVRRNSVLDVIDNRRQRLTDSKAVGNG